MKKAPFRGSQVQGRISAYPAEYEEFCALERALCSPGSMLHIDPVHMDAATRRLNDLDRLFGFENESQMRKSGIETSHWEGRK
jgi:hypothetical protein